ncbi:MAG: hypothetical protein FJW39_16445 [Acidobacteria bacterium]|nr:hypothetical protein [Acidobacteriota bacterium]
MPETLPHEDSLALLARIAEALERIADSMHRTDPPNEDSPARDAPPAEVAETGNDSRIEKLLAQRGVKVRTVPPEIAENDLLDKLALFMGSKLDSIRRVYDLIRSNMSDARPIRLSLAGEPQLTVAATTNFCTNAYKLAYLTNYRYQKAPAFQLYLTPSNDPKALNFFSGQWLERFVRAQLVMLLNQRGLRFTYMMNPQIVLPNGDDFELDGLFEVEGTLFWFEAKTGKYQGHISRYSRMSSILGLDRAHSFMILANDSIDAPLAAQLSLQFNMTVVSIEEFAGVFSAALDKLHRPAIVEAARAAAAPGPVPVPPVQVRMAG